MLQHAISIIIITATIVIVEAAAAAAAAAAWHPLSCRGPPAAPHPQPHLQRAPTCSLRTGPWPAADADWRREGRREQRREGRREQRREGRREQRR
jgi:hypothetical protein